MSFFMPLASRLPETSVQREQNSRHNSHNGLRKFRGLQQIPVRWNPRPYQERRSGLPKEIGFLEALVEELPESDDQGQSTRSDFFGDLDIDIQRVSQQLFKNGHHAEAVSNAFKELNHQVKQEYKRRKIVGLDGAN
jgi:hypothetical protein